MTRSIKKLALRRNTIRSMNEVACELEMAEEPCTVRTRFASTCVGVPAEKLPPN